MKNEQSKLTVNLTAAEKAGQWNAREQYLTPGELGQRWHWHQESIRRMLRERRMVSVIISRRRLIPLSEIARVEAEGRIARFAQPA